MKKDSFSSVPKNTKDLIRTCMDLTHLNKFALNLLYKLKESVGEGKGE
jgi:hypothetical protein